MNSTGSDELGAGRAGSSPPRRGLWLLAGLVFLTGLAVAMLVVDRRGARILAPPPSPEGMARPAAPALLPSSVSLEVQYDLDVLREILEAQVPEGFGDLDERRRHPDNPRISYAVAIEREVLELEVRGDTARLTVIVRYRGLAWFDSPFGSEIRASCGAREDGGPVPRAIIRLASPLEVGPDWHIGSSIRVEEVGPASGSERDRCEVDLGPFRMDVTDQILAVAEVRIRETTGEIDAAIGELNLRSAVADHWARIQEPIRLGEGMWLQLEPDSIRMGPMEGRGPHGQVIAARFALVGRPRIVVGVRPSGTPAPLPPLGKRSVPERFQARVEGRIDYRTASRLMSAAVRGREITVGRRVLRIDDVEVSAVGDGRLAVRVDVEGAVRGRLYLVGSPVFDPDTDEVRVPDLEFSVETRNVLLRGAVWLVRGTVPERIRRAVRWDASRVLQRARGLVGTGLNRSLGPGVRLEGILETMAVSGVFADPEALVVRSSLEGTLRIRGTVPSALSREMSSAEPASGESSSFRAAPVRDAEGGPRP